MQMWSFIDAISEGLKPRLSLELLETAKHLFESCSFRTSSRSLVQLLWL